MQPIIRNKGQLLFHIAPGWFGWLFSHNKGNHLLKNISHATIKICLVDKYKCEKHVQD